MCCKGRFLGSDGYVMLSVIERVLMGEGRGLYMLVLIAAGHVSYPAVQYISMICTLMTKATIIHTPSGNLSAPS